MSSMVRGKPCRGSSGHIPNKKSRRNQSASEVSNHSSKVVTVIDDIIKSPVDEKRLFRYLELKNGLKVMLITDLSSCEYEDDSDEEESQGPVCHDADIDHFNEHVLGFKKPPCCDCAEHHRQVPQRKPILANCRDCREKSYVCLTVGAGSHNDPLEASGLAHLCEHMIFMGSKKYPEPSHLDDFITAHGGAQGWNGRTHGENTMFQYDIMCFALRRSLDILVSYFIGPLIPLELVNKERSVVDSEFQGKKTIDWARRAALLQSLGKTDHPVCQPGWGDRETLRLSPKIIHRLLHDFQQKWYCSDNMTLAIKSPASFDEIEDMILDTFGKLERRGTPMLSLASQPFPYDTPAFRRIYRMVPTKNDDIIYISWELPADAVYNYETKVAELISYYLGSECKNGLSYYLRTRYWALGIKTEVGDSNSDQSQSSVLLHMQVYLTKLGLENIENILEAVFSYLKFVNSIGPLNWIFREYQLISALEFHFPRSDPETEAYDPGADEDANRIVDIASDLQLFKPRDVLVGAHIPTKWDPNRLAQYMALLRPSRANFMILSKSFAKLADLVEPIHGTRYSVQDISSQLMNRLENVRIFPNFDVILRNPFITTNFCPVRPENRNTGSEDSDYSTTSDESDDDSDGEPGSARFPTCILETDRLELWHKLDPGDRAQAEFFFEFASPLVNQDAHSCALLDVWIELMKFRLKPAICAAKKALLILKISRGSNGMQLEISGHSQKLGKIFNFFLDQFSKMSSKMTPELFAISKETALINYYNVLSSPEELHKKLSTVVQSTSKYLEATLYTVLNGLTYEEYQRFSRSFMTKLFVFGLAEGNVLETTFKRMGRKLVKALKFRPVVSSEDLTEPCLRQIPLGETIIRVRSFNSDDSTFCVSNNYRTIDAELLEEPNAAAVAVLRSSCILKQIANWINEPAFNYLRVEKQLGYDIVIENSRTVLSIRIHGDSGKLGASEVQAEIDKFMRNFYETNIKCMTQRKLSSSSIDSDDDVTPPEQNWFRIRDGSYDFGRESKENKIIKNLQVNDIQDFYQNFLLPGPASKMRKLCIQIVAAGDKEFPVETEDRLPGILLKDDTPKSDLSCVQNEEPQIYPFPLTFLSPRPKRSKPCLQTRDKYVTNLRTFTNSCFIYPKHI